MQNCTEQEKEKDRKYLIATKRGLVTEENYIRKSKSKDLF